MSAIDYEADSDELKKELLLNAKRFAINELFGELITAYTKIENYKLTQDQSTSYSAAYIRIDGNPIYESGKNFGRFV